MDWVLIVVVGVLFVAMIAMQFVSAKKSKKKQEEMQNKMVVGTEIMTVGGIVGKIQFGSAWWFNDQKDGMNRQMEALMQVGLISKFVGMLTDSRSFLSYTRHEYFRRIL